MEIASPATALSPAVRRLICGIGCDHCDQIRFGENESRSNANIGCLVSTVDLRLDQIAALLPAPDNTAEYFEKAVSALAPVFTQCQHALSRAATASYSSDLQSTLLSKLWWTQSQQSQEDMKITKSILSALQVFCDFMEMMKTDLKAGPKNIISLLIVSAVLERSLGNVYLLKGSQCPSMLKDLLVTEELADILGVSVVQMLRVVMGPPISLNLRNVAWHGFLADGELPNRYCCFLVLLAASMGDLLSRKGIDKVPHRPYFTWTSEVQCKMLISSPGSKKVISNLQAIKDVLVESSLIQPQMDGQWQLIVSDLYPNDRCGYCLALLLPLLEHCLRRVFATVNSCPERVLTAESSAFYTTFSEMLEKTLPDGTTNKLPEFLTTPCMDLLQDLLFYPDGPRIRDHISHGEIDFEAVDEKFVYPFVCFAVFLAHRLRPELPSFANSCIQEMVQKIHSYRSVFHPVAILQQKFGGLLTLLDMTRDFVHVSADLELLGHGDGPSKLCEDNELFTRTQRELTSLWQCQAWAKACAVSKDDLLDCLRTSLDSLHKLSQEHIPTLFRWQFEGNTGGAGVMKESEYVGLLLRITEECSTATQQIHHTLQQRQKQLAQKVLRSRQRDNLKKLLTCVPCLVLLKSWLAASLGWNIQLLHNFASLEPNNCRMLQKHLKQTLQHCENVRTFTASDKNKWTESVQLLLGLIPKCQNFFLQWSQLSS